VTIQGGDSSSGGGIYNDGVLTLTNDNIVANQASQAGGGLFNDGIATVSGTVIQGNTSGYAGGGVYNASAMTITNSTLAGNSAHYYGGGLINVWGDVALTGDYLTQNYAGWDGGGIEANEPVTLNETFVIYNSSGGNVDIGGLVDPASSNNFIGYGGTSGLVNGVNGNIVNN
jgi:hypothetical protein